jgi:hypothetical protein
VKNWTEPDQDEIQWHAVFSLRDEILLLLLLLLPPPLLLLLLLLLLYGSVIGLTAV